MVSTFTVNKNIEKPAHNDYVNTWDVPVNLDWDQIDKAFGNSVTKNATGLSGNVTLAVADYVPLTIIISGLPTAAITYVVPSGVGGQWVFANATTGGFNVGIKSNAGGTTINVPAGQNTLVSCDGSATGMRLSITTTPVAAGSNTQVQFNNAGVLGASSNLTWDGTTLGLTGLSNAGNTALGDAAGDVLTINGTAVTIPNNLNFDANTLFIDSTNNRVGIGTITPASPLTVAGTIESTSGGVKYPDATVQTTVGMRPFSTQTVIAGTQMIFTGVPTGVNSANWLLKFDFIPSTLNAQLYTQFYNSVGSLINSVIYIGSVFSYSGFSIGNQNNSNIGHIITTAVGNVNSIPISGEMMTNNTQTASKCIGSNWIANYLNNDNTTLVGVVGNGILGLAAGNAPLTGLRIVITAGTFTGQATLFIGP